MERVITNYIRALRMAGADVSPAEAIEAARALAVIGYAERPIVRDALGIVLAKNEDEKALHERLFDLYFDPGPPTESGETEETTSDEDRESGDGAGEGDPAQAMEDLANSPDGERMAMAMTAAAAAAGVDNIRFASQTAYFARRMLESMGVKALEERLMQALDDRTAEGQARAETLIEARRRLTMEARTYVDRRFEVFGKAATENFMDEVVAGRAIDKLSLRDMERMKAIVARMARRLAVRHSRRRKVRNRGRLDLRRTLRDNAGVDGVPFKLTWKRQKQDKPKIVAICDVSGSVAAYVRFLLMFLFALNETVADLGAFAFSARLADVSEPLRALTFDAAFDIILQKLSTGGTDYGQALVDLRDNHWDLIDRRTTVLILGDGRSNDTNPRFDLFAEMADRAKRVVWLCPEPPGRWGSGDSRIPDYKTLCTTLTYCATATDLERALDEILLAYD